jgi:transposase-like protein
VPPPQKNTVELTKGLIDQLRAAAGGGAGLIGPDGLLKKLTTAMVSRALDAEMSEHLENDSGQRPPPAQDNRRNRRRTKQVRTERCDIAVEVLRDRDGTFEPRLVGKHHRFFDGFDDEILSMYVRGMTTRDIQRHLTTTAIASEVGGARPCEWCSREAKAASCSSHFENPPATFQRKRCIWP